MHILMALIGALLGAMTGGDGGLLVGGFIGLFGSLIWRQNRTISELQARLDLLDPDPGKAPADPVPAPTQSRTGQVSIETQASVPQAAPDPAVTGEPAAATTSAQNSSDWTPPPIEPSALDKRVRAFAEAIIRFATTGNPVVRIGAVVLFIGVAYLMRYAYEHSLVPLELRLAGAALGGVVLLAVGWRLRGRTDTYGLILQGVGLAILYLTVFAASRLYGFVPMGAAFPMLVVLVAGASVLAVLQKSQALAIFSMSGGFLAPVLTSTGEGSHVALFSYYALLNTGILAMAWFQHWRWLNWTGFIFTFVIGASWGFEYYQPEYYASTQPFLILFFLFYLVVSILFARRQEVKLTGVVDGTLVFGAPVIAFALQAGLVQDMEFGLAYSALAAALVYAALGWWLKRQGQLAELLDQSFVALAVVFATLAIPFAFDNQRFTAATWALEGAGVFWVGVRQAQRLPRAFGLLLQLAAGVIFASEIGRGVGDLLFLNSAYIGAAFLGLAGVFTACVIGRNTESLTRFEPLIGAVMLVWGVIWWLSGGVRELSWYTPGEEMFASTNLGEHFFLIYAALSAAVLTFLARRLEWRQGLLPAFVLLPVGALLLLELDVNWVRDTAFSDFGWLAWPLLFAVGYWHLRSLDEDQPLAALWHAFSWWFLTLFITWNTAALVKMAGDFVTGSVWVYVTWGVVPLVVSVGMLSFRDDDRWPFNRYPGAYFGWGWMVGLGYLAMWLLATGFVRGDADPIPYLLLVNPIELTQLGILMLGVQWLRRLPAMNLTGAEQICRTIVGGLAFFWINTVTARAVHYYGGVPYPIDQIVESDAFLTTVTILWTFIALGLMGFATRRSGAWLLDGRGWIAGSGDSQVVPGGYGQPGAAGSYGHLHQRRCVLMLVIGYFAPLPPKQDDDMEAQAHVKTGWSTLRSFWRRSLLTGLQANQSDFARGRVLDAPDGVVVARLVVPDDVYEWVVRRDLGDVRVLNRDQEEVPYNLRRPASRR